MDQNAEKPKHYRYQSLNNGQIRILHLQPGEITDTIFIEISHEYLHDEIQEYHALSWEWGKEPPSEDIRIKDKESTESDVWTMKIKPNLSSALKYLRLKDKIRRLWVDAICINQSEDNDTQQAASQNRSGDARSIPNGDQVPPNFQPSDESEQLVSEEQSKVEQTVLSRSSNEGEPLSESPINEADETAKHDDPKVFLEKPRNESQLLPKEAAERAKAAPKPPAKPTKYGRRISQTLKERKISEKAHQISMMNQIYGQAAEVSVWLGDERDNSTKAINFIESIVGLKEFDVIAGFERSTKSIAMGSDLEALIKLLKRGWFGRRWVVQEIALAQTATVYCGDKSTSWENVADAVALLENFGRGGAINRTLKNLPITNHVPEYIGNISSLPAYRLVQNTTGLFRGKESKQITGFRTWRYTLEELVSFLAAFKASRAHDTIYAILGLASDFTPVDGTESKIEHQNEVPKRDTGQASRTPRRSVTMKEGPNLERIETNERRAALQELRRQNTTLQTGWSRDPKKFPVDYTLPVLQVFKDFLDRAIKNSQSLDILCRPWAPSSGLNAEGEEEKIDLPSWMASLSRKPFQETKERNMVRFNPDPLVGAALFRHRIYGASGGEELYCDIDLKNPNSKRITVKGFVLDTIGEIWDSAAFGNVPAIWLTEGGGWTDVEEVPPGELWRTLVADRNGHGSEPDRWYPLVFKSAAKDRGLSYGFETYRLIYESGNSAVSEVFKRVQAVVWNRRLIRTQGQYMKWWTNGKHESGALGLVPREARKDDLICIIFGCSVPLVLRKIVATPSRNGSNPTIHGRIGKGPEETNSNTVNSTTANTAPEELYTLIGECYIDHMMDGEAIFYKNESDVESQNFILE